MKYFWFLIGLFFCLDLSGQFPLTQILAGDDTDSFGYSVDLSGNYAIIGSYRNRENSSGAGAAYIFENQNGNWSQIAKLTANDGARNDYFGISVSISNNQAIVGAYYDDDSGSQSGSAYIFENQNGNWNQIAKLTADDANVYDRFGISVSIIDDYAFVGAHLDDDNGSNTGSVYIFKKEGATWLQYDKLTSTNTSSFGTSISLFEDKIFIGAPNSNAAYIFEHQNNTWIETHKLTPNDAVLFNKFGYSVSIHDNYAIVGAYGDDDKDTDAGSIYIFENQNGTWLQVTKLTAEDGTARDYFGHSVSIYGNYAIVGAYKDDDKGTDSGSAYIFENQNGEWRQISKLTLEDGASEDYFGYAVFMSENHTIIGAYQDDDPRFRNGSVYTMSPCETFYVDVDLDNYGNPDSSNQFCFFAPTGFVLDSTDCNDTDSLINPEIYYYKDADNDGYGDINNKINGCYSNLDNYVLNAIDCNDADANLNVKTYYKDEDNDGYGNIEQSLMFKCDEVPNAYVENSTDCDDSNANINLETYYFKDADGDRYGDPNIRINSCDSLPVGYVLDSTDCDDSNYLVHQHARYFVDADFDGYGNPNHSILICDTIPVGYAGNNLDIDDGDQTKPGCAIEACIKDLAGNNFTHKIRLNQSRNYRASISGIVGRVNHSWKQIGGGGLVNIQSPTSYATTILGQKVGLVNIEYKIIDDKCEFKDTVNLLIEEFCSPQKKIDNHTILVTNTDSYGSGSFSEAIECANLNPSLDTIKFEIPGEGPFSIMDVGVELKDNGIVIDGRLQEGYNALDFIRLYSTSTTRNGVINIESDSCKIFGLNVIVQSYLGQGILIQGNSNIVGELNGSNLLTFNYPRFYNGTGLIAIEGNNNIIQSNLIGVNKDGINKEGVGDGIVISNRIASPSGNIIGGSRLNREGNIIGSNRGISCFGTRNLIKGNNIGIGVDNNTSLFGLIKIFTTDVGIRVGGPGNTIGGNSDEINLIGYYFNGVEFNGDDFSQTKIANNAFICNRRGIFNYRKSNPIIESISVDSIKGSSVKGDTIDLYLSNIQCSGYPCQGEVYLGSTYTNSEGEWFFSTPLSIKLYDQITAIAKDSINISEFSPCFIVLPDDCRFAEPLPINKNACSSTGAVLDLKQLTASTPAPTSSCSTTFAGNDAWYKIAVPSTGNFLVRTNINNTVVPVIEVYTGCGNDALPECRTLDTLPYTMIFENYTPEDTLYLRVWDKNNEVVNSENTALLHLTAHKLDSLKENWEICDYENLISDNPTNLTRREANTFILNYDKNTPQSEINQNNAVFTDMMEMELKRECACGGTPLQLWSTENPVVLDGRRRYAKRRGNVDTTNYNYIFETVEFQVNSYAIGQQHATDIAMDIEGNFAMVWKDEQRRHNYGRVYLSSGNPVTVEFQIGSSTKTQYATSIEMLANGDFITVWHEIDASQAGATFAVYGRLFNADGTYKTEVFDISTTSANTSSDAEIKELAQYGTNAQVSADANGNFVVVWHVGGSIFAQRYDADANLIGKIIEVGATVDAGIAPNPSIALNASGAFIITWNGRDNEDNGIYAQRFSASGTALGAAFLVNGNQVKEQKNPDIALWDDGSFTIVWESLEQFASDSDYDIYVQRFDATANKIGTEFLVNIYTQDAQDKPSISKFANGSFIIAWSSFGQDGFAEGIYAKLFEANGNPVIPSFNDSEKGSLGEEFRLNTYNNPQQDKPQTTTNGENIFMGAWEDGANDGSYEGIFAQRFETIDVDNTRIFYPIGTATPSTLMGDEMPYPTTTYNPGTSVKKAKVAILDTGIDHTHELIQSAIWYNPEANDSDNCLTGDEIGYDFVNRTGTPLDLDGHGTQVNGILTRDFNTEVKLELMNLKFHELKKGSVFDAICGIYYAVDNGANIINLSWGFEASEEPGILKKALQYASDKDVLIVTTAGNTSGLRKKLAAVNILQFLSFVEPFELPF